VIEEPVVEEPVIEAPVVVAPAPVEPVVVAPAPVEPVVAATPAQPKTLIPPKPLEVDVRSPAKDTAPATQGGGLAGAIARSREIKQDLDRTRRQKAQDQGVRKI
jgi:fused signal recognition particle receptor